MYKLVRRLLVLGFFSLSVAWAADWPHFLGPNADGISPETGINKDWKAKPPKELWRIELSDDGYAGPSVAAGKLYIVDHKGAQDIVRAVDVSTGKDVWAFSYPDPAKANYGFTRATPTWENGKVYTYSRYGVAHCLDAEKGDKIWSRDVKRECKGKYGGWEYAGSPVLDGEKLVLPLGGAGDVAVLNKATGQTVWTGGGNDEAGYATPVIASLGGKKQYVVFNGLALVGVDGEAAGPPLWRFPWQTQYNVNAATPRVIESTIFITSDYNHGCALISVADGKAAAVWQNASLDAHFNTPILCGGYLYGIGNRNGLLCLEPKTGKMPWNHPGFEKGGLIGIDGVLIAVCGGSGEVVMAKIDPAAYQELGRIKPLGGQSWTAPIAADGKLYIRNRTALVCLDLK
ncbi:MAG: PQQ-binding-like beta-propeller repeat protein [Planctomycetota bacterium]